MQDHADPSRSARVRSVHGLNLSSHGKTSQVTILDERSYTICTTLMARRPWRAAWFEWDDSNRAHVAGHGVEEVEVEEIFHGRVYIRRVRHGYAILGATATGRRLFVVVARRSAGGVRPITARDMNLPERRLFERRAR